jgi:hypothetical protein
VDDRAANEAGYPVRDPEDLVARVNAGEAVQDVPHCLEAHHPGHATHQDD